MNIFVGIIGVVCILLAVVDVLWTTLLLRGGGPLTSRVNILVWQAALRMHHVRPSHRLLAYTGLIILLLTILLWIGLIWVGWFCVFSTDAGAVLEAQSNQPANLSSRFYFVGYTLITLGLGDYKAGDSIWQVATVLAATNGFFVVTLMITYLLPIVSAIVHKRQLAMYLTSLGADPTSILTNAWNGHDFRTLSQHFATLTTDVLKLGQQYLAYPVLHYYHSQEHYSAIAPRLAALDEVLTLLECGVVPDQQPDAAELLPLRMAITNFLATLETVFIVPDADPPPLPDLMQFRAQGIQTVADDAFEQATCTLAQRRQMLFALVRRDGWSWNDVHAALPLEKRVTPTLHQ